MPRVTVIEPVVVKALKSVQSFPVPLNVTPPVGATETPFVVTVFPVVPLEKVIVPVADHTVPATSEKLPVTMTAPLVPAKVTDPAEQVKFRHMEAVVDSVTVYVADWSKNTSSVDVGTLAPPAPPEGADQFVVRVPFQIPDPPTQ